MTGADTRFDDSNLKAVHHRNDSDPFPRPVRLCRARCVRFGPDQQPHQQLDPRRRGRRRQRHDQWLRRQRSRWPAPLGARPGRGPTLSSFGVTNPLTDPAIQVTAGNGTVIAVNDNVGTAPNLQLLNTVTSAAGAFPLTSANDAALLIGVPAGAYTVQLHTNAATEARPALLEVYEFGAVAAGMTSQTIAGLAAANPNLSTLATALRVAGLDSVVATGGPFTVFAPTNAAFAALPAATLNGLLANPAQLAQVLLFHVASGQVLSTQLTNGQNITTLRSGARPLVVNLTGGAKIDNANVVAADVRALNGVVHVIDAVLLP